MPVVFVEPPAGIHRDPKKRMVGKITSSMGEVYLLPADNRIFLRESPHENASWAGLLQSENSGFTEAIKKLRGGGRSSVGVEIVPVRST
jgi:hypothetical protein